MDAIYYQVNSFTDHVFGGNPAGVCHLMAWPSDEILQKIASENNFSETAFFTRNSEGTYKLRWFTPTTEVDLCGHATLATAHVLWRHEGETKETITFLTKSGSLTVTRGEKYLITMNFPSWSARVVPPPPDVKEILSAEPIACLQARDYLFEFANEETVRNLKPDILRLAGWSTLGVIATAPGREVDFVSRFFAPRAGIPEDPVTGSAHCTLIPFWAARLGKTSLHARQVSARGGELFCENLGERVKIAGRAITYLNGVIEVKDSPPAHPV